MMGEYAELALAGFVDEETGEIIDGDAPGYPRRMSDRKAERQFRDGKPAKTCSCIIPGCGQKFRGNTHYNDFLTHYKAKHGKQS